MNTDSDPVHLRIADRATRTPDATAVVQGRTSVTYRELVDRAERVAAGLGAAGAGRGTVVLAHLDRSIDLVSTFLGILRAGGVYLPVDPDVPAARLAAVVRETGCPVAVAGAEHATRLAGTGVRVVAPDGAEPTGTRHPAAGPGDTAYLVYTSGSTGSPKAVRVPHGALSRLCTAVTGRYGIGPDDRVLQFAATSFDTSIEQIMVTLVNGATLVLPEYTWAPSELPARIREHGVTVMDLSPPYWRSFLAAAGDVADLPVRLTIVGGSAVRAEDCRVALARMPRSRLVNAYGLTETTVTSCTAEITAGELPASGPAPVGVPLPGTGISLRDEDLSVVPAGAAGEVCIDGDGLAEDPPGVPARFATAPDGTRLYRTGDRGRWDEHGRLVVTGRTDRQVKIRGYRVEPSEIENALARHPAIRDVVVVPVEQNGELDLVAYLTTAPGADPPASAELRSHLGDRLPAYLVPAGFTVLPEMPTTAHGKIDVAALPAPDAGPAVSGPPPEATATRVEQAVAKLWAQVLGLDAVGPGDNFFALGGDSTRAAELMANLRATLGIQITQVRPLIRLLLADASLRGFAAAVEQARSGALADPAEAGLDVERESRLDVPVTDRPLGEPDWADPRTVVLTGATGFLGVYLLRELLRSTRATVHCLVRARDRDAAAARIRDTALHYLGDDLDRDDLAGRVVAHPGDLAEPLLGLDQRTFDDLARAVDVVHHPGGMVNFIYPYSHMRAANVAGTREIVRLAGRYRNAPVHYTSTMAVVSGFGTAGVQHVTERTPLGHPDHLSVGYVESKWIAERLLGEASRAGLPVAIYRAADISGDQERGAWNTATEMCAMKRFVVDTGVAPIAELPLDYTPVDVFAAAVVHIARGARPAGEVYHLTNPGKVNVHELVERLRAHGHPIREIPWDEWLDRLITTAVEEPDHPMTPFAPLFIDRERTGRMSVAEMYLEDTFPSFDRDNVDRALAGSGITIPPVGPAMLDRYLTYLTSIKFLGEPA